MVDITVTALFIYSDEWLAVVFAVVTDCDFPEFVFAGEFDFVWIGGFDPFGLFKWLCWMLGCTFFAHDCTFVVVDGPDISVIGAALFLT